MSHQQQQPTHWLPAKSIPIPAVDCLCLGTGRFLRAVLVPALNAAGLHPVLVQTRGRSFLEYMHRVERDDCSPLKEEESPSSFPIDTVLTSGDIQTDWIPCYGAFSWGREDDRQAFQDWFQQQDLGKLRVIGLGVTEAGLASAETTVMQHMYQLFRAIMHRNAELPQDKICILNTDNIPLNGSLVKQYMETLARREEKEESTQQMLLFLQNHVVFLDSMVDRITSERPGSAGLVPRAEPLPTKALVLLDEGDDLPNTFQELDSSFGIVLRRTRTALENDIALKLRVANGTHTAVAHAMALLCCPMTDVLSKTNERSGVLLLEYLDALFEQQILPASLSLLGSTEDECRAVYQDWRRRLTHPHFGLSSFFITQNGPAKGGIRLGPTVLDLIVSERSHISVAMAFAFAALLRWLTPQAGLQAHSGIFRGWFPPTVQQQDTAGCSKVEEYADQLRYNVAENWYEFRCSCSVTDLQGRDKNLSEWLAALTTSCQQPVAFLDVVRAYLVSNQGGNLQTVHDSPPFGELVQGVATLYARMLAGDNLLGLLQEMKDCQGGYTQGMNTSCRVLMDAFSATHERPLHYQACSIPDDSALMKSAIDLRSVESVVYSEVASVQAIDVHTHLLPPSHGALCLWGIDELLTYHYLIAEYFMNAPATMTPEKFFAMTKRQQADVIWNALFLNRLPLSEACRGVVTVLRALGLSKEVESRDLEEIRAFYTRFRTRGIEGAEEFSELVHKTAGVRYNIMTNIPFDTNEAQHWRPERKLYSKNFRSALRVDPLLAGDKTTIENSLAAAGYDKTLEGARQYLRDWCDTIKPEYMMASTPHDFVLADGVLSAPANKSINEEAMKQPGAFAEMVSDPNTCTPTEDDAPSVISEHSEFLRDVLMKVCEERDLPIALKIGAHRGVNPRLRSAGDGMVAFADAGMLGRLCERFPRVRFLATFLSRNNQHEACVLASKFRNLHIYGCWWYCNNPSIIREVTHMRMEMLGTAFTAQHSDARVVDQLLYKWGHSRAVIASVLVVHVERLIESGWKPLRSEIRRDIAQLFGGSYEEFMRKSFITP